MGISLSQLGSAPLPSAGPVQDSKSPAAAVAGAVTQAVTPQQQDAAADQSAALAEALQQIEVAVQAKANNLQFSVDDSSGKTIVRVVDSSSGSTIRQIPSEEALAIARDIERMRGLLLRDSA